MSLNSAVIFGKASDNWATPQAFFDELNREFHFSLDVAARKATAKCGAYFGPDSDEPSWRDALSIPWAFVCEDMPLWMNPPYSQCRQFIAKAAREAEEGATIVALVPSRTDTHWWHEHVWDTQKHRPRPGVEVRFVKGRLKFGGTGKPENSAPFPSVVIVFRPPV